MLLAVSQHLGTTDPAIPRIATAFGGGIGGTGAVCGAVVGAVMGLGLKHGRESASERDLELSARARELCRRFAEETGALDCRKLTGIDLTTREGARQFYASNLLDTVCVPAVGVAYRLGVELLDRPAPG